MDLTITAIIQSDQKRLLELSQLLPQEEHTLSCRIRDLNRQFDDVLANIPRLLPKANGKWLGMAGMVSMAAITSPKT